MPTKRNYVRERLMESPKRKKDRAARNKARREAGLKVGDPRTADHKKPLRSGGSNSKSNVRIRSASANSADNGGKGGRPKGGRKSLPKRTGK